MNIIIITTNKIQNVSTITDTLQLYLCSRSWGGEKETASNLY